jgi:hypothetical protein
MLREESKLRVSENRVLRCVFGNKRDKVTGGCRRRHNQELHKLYAYKILLGLSNQGV